MQTVLLSVPGLTAAPGGMAMAGISGRGIVLAPLLNNQFAYFYESLSGWVVQAIPPATSTLYWAADIDANNQPLLAAFIPGLGTRLIRRKEDGTWLSEMIPLELPPSRGMDLMAYPDGRVLFIVGAGSSDSSYELEWFERTTSGYWNLIAHITNPSGLSSPGIYPSPDRSTVTVLAFASPYYKSAIRLHPGGVWTGGTLGPALDNLTAVSAFSTPEGRFGVLSRGFINTSAKGTRPFVLYLESP